MHMKESYITLAFHNSNKKIISLRYSKILLLSLIAFITSLEYKKIFYQFYYFSQLLTSFDLYLQISPFFFIKIAQNASSSALYVMFWLNVMYKSREMIWLVLYSDALIFWNHNKFVAMITGF